MATWFLWHVALLPALVSAGVLAATWLIARRARFPMRSAGTNALALVCGYAAGHVGLEGWRPFPPREAADWLRYFAFFAVLLSFLDAWPSYPRWLRWALHAGLWTALVWELLPPAIRQESSRGEIAAWLAGLSLAVFLFWLLMDTAARRQSGAIAPMISLIASVGSVVVLHFSRSFKLTELAGVLAASLLPILGRTLFRPATRFAAAPVGVLLPGLWLTSYFYDYKPPPIATLLLLAAAALTGALGLLPGVRALAPWQRSLLSVAAALLLIAWAAIRSLGTGNEEEYLLLSRGFGETTTINCRSG